MLTADDTVRDIARMKRHKNFMDPEEFVRNYRWPRKGDRLLRASDDWNRAVQFSEHPISRHVHIWSGYISAGASLVDECERDSGNRHFLIYPILFVYRHGLELAMKWVISQYGRYANVSLGDDELNHNLWSLWSLCKQVISNVGSEGTTEEEVAVQAVEQIVKDFHDLDKNAQAFRYSTTKNGVAIKLPDVSVDLENIRDVMEAVDNFFTGVDGQLDANVSAVDWEMG